MSETKSCRALCKFRGMLVVAEVSVRPDLTPGRCPECGSEQFTERYGWTECGCGFAYSTNDIQKLLGRGQSKTRYRSIAVWPTGVLLGNPDGGNESCDLHDTEQQAAAVCRMLERDGFGGNRKVFPLSTRTEPVTTGHP
jgi:hypothetical protein